LDINSTQDEREPQLGVTFEMERSLQPTLGAFRSSNPAIHRCTSPYGGVEQSRRVVRFAQLPARRLSSRHLKPSIGCADHLTADSFCLSMTLDRIGVG
jgi:hypothetical protein